MIELLFGIIYSFILNWKINQVYPWLKSNVALEMCIRDRAGFNSNLQVSILGKVSADGQRSLITIVI